MSETKRGQRIDDTHYAVEIHDSQKPEPQDAVLSTLSNSVGGSPQRRAISLHGAAMVGRRAQIRRS